MENVIFHPFADRSRRFSSKFLTLLTLILCFWHSNAYSQYIEIFSLGSKIFRVEATFESPKPIKVEITHLEIKKSFEFSMAAPDVFFTLFEENVIALTMKDGKSPLSDSAFKERITSRAFALYNELLAYEITRNEIVPPSGTLTITRDIRVEPSSDSVPCGKSNRKIYLNNLIARNKILAEDLIALIEKDKAESLFIGTIDRCKVIKTEMTRIQGELEKLSRSYLKKEIVQNKKQNLILAAQISEAKKVIEEYNLVKQREDQLKAQTELFGDEFMKKLSSVSKALGVFSAEKGVIYHHSDVLKKFIIPDQVSTRMALSEKYITKQLEQKPKSIKQVFDTVSQVYRFCTEIRIKIENQIVEREEASAKLVSRIDSLNTVVKKYQAKLKDILSDTKTDPDSKQKRQSDSSYYVAAIEDCIKDTVNAHNNLTEKKAERISLKELYERMRWELTENMQDFLQSSERFSDLMEKISVAEAALKKQQALFDSARQIPKFRLKRLQLQFEMGTLYKAVAIGTYLGKEVAYSRGVPVSFSSLNDIRRFNRYELRQTQGGSTAIRLTDLMRFDPELGNHSDDYSPADSTYNILMSDDPQRMVQTFKERTDQILEAKAFTDFMGYFPDRPNGLIQFEVSKKVSINAHSLFKRHLMQLTILRYYHPSLVMSKIEQSNKFYYIPTKDVTKGKGQISSLDLFKYASWRFKLMNLNLIQLSIDDWKTSIEINGAYSLFYTPVRDSLGPDKIDQWGAVSGMPSGEVRLVFRPDVRYGLTLSANYGWIFLWDSKLVQINDPEHPYDATSYNRKLLTFQFDGFFRPFRTNRSAFFVRISNVHSFPFENTYLQFQAGYSFNIMNKTGSK